MSGFMARAMGWVGPQPTDRQDGGNIGAVLLRGQLERQAEQTRPAAEHGAWVKRALVAQVPADLVDDVRATGAELRRLESRVRETQAALAEHLAYQPEEHELEDWLLERFRLEGTLPHLRRLHAAALTANGAAIEAARRSIAAVCRERGEQALRTWRDFQERQRVELQEAETAFLAERNAIARAGTLTAADLEE